MDAGAPVGPKDLDHAAAMDLLAKAPYGRIVFVHDGAHRRFGR